MSGDRSNGLADWLNRPLYNYAEADRLAGVSRGTAQRWLTGYGYYDTRGRFITQPPVTPGTVSEGGVSFIDLVEIVAIGGLKEQGFPLRQIRQIVANCQEILKVARPLATLRFKTDGREIFVDRDDALVDVGRRKRRRAWEEVLRPYLETLDYNADDLAHRWWPMGRDERILVDPDYGFGFPVVADTGVRTEIILERFQAGDLNDQIAEDFNITTLEVQRALQFELQRAA
jgi:uncharacterized protein (DUF433 family)